MWWNVTNMTDVVYRVKIHCFEYCKTIILPPILLDFCLFILLLKIISMCVIMWYFILIEACDKFCKAAPVRIHSYVSEQPATKIVFY